jgi:hypothetical protein
MVQIANEYTANLTNGAVYTVHVRKLGNKKRNLIKIRRKSPVVIIDKNQGLEMGPLRFMYCFLRCNERQL